MTKKISLLIILIILLVMAGVYWEEIDFYGDFVFLKEKISELLSLGKIKGACYSSAIATAIKTKGLNDVRSCGEEKFDVNGEKMSLVAISHGHGADCPSGCIYAVYIGLVDKNGRIYDFYSLPNPFYTLAMKYGTNCATFNYQQDQFSYYERKIVRLGEGFHWELLFNNFDPVEFRPKEISGIDHTDPKCVINGKLISLSSSLKYAADFPYFDDSQLYVTSESFKRGAVDENICMNIPKKNYETHNYGQNFCYNKLAFIKKDITICEKISSDYERKQCIENIEKVLGIFNENYNNKRN